MIDILNQPTREPDSDPAPMDSDGIEIFAARSGLNRLCSRCKIGFIHKQESSDCEAGAVVVAAEAAL